LKVKRVGDIIQWDESQDAPVEIEIGEVAGHIIKRELTRLDSEGQLQMEFLPLYEHFVEGEDWPLDVAEATSESGAEPIPIKQPEPRTTAEVLGSRPAAEGSKD
ncbi:hypothetical protein LCGC14_2380770, partial [marine sediment metagenome]